MVAPIGLWCLSTFAIARDDQGGNPLTVGHTIAQKPPARFRFWKPTWYLRGAKKEKAGGDPGLHLWPQIEGPSRADARSEEEACSLNGNRTRISALRGLRPKPLDDKATEGR